MQTPVLCPLPGWIPTIPPSHHALSFPSWLPLSHSTLKGKPADISHADSGFFPLYHLSHIGAGEDSRLNIFVINKTGNGLTPLLPSG